MEQIRIIGGISIDQDSYKKTGFHGPDTNGTKDIEGVIVSGISLGNLNRLVIVLANRGIAGHSKDTQIFYHKGKIIRPKK